MYYGSGTVAHRVS